MDKKNNIEHTNTNSKVSPEQETEKNVSNNNQKQNQLDPSAMDQQEGNMDNGELGGNFNSSANRDES
jgi:hypothetical protein